MPLHGRTNFESFRDYGALHEEVSVFTTIVLMVKGRVLVQLARPYQSMWRLPSKHDRDTEI